MHVTNIHIHDDSYSHCSLDCIEKEVDEKYNSEKIKRQTRCRRELHLDCIAISVAIDVGLEKETNQ